jgi:hypothetical protein
MLGFSNRTFWNLSFYENQRNFICQNMQDKTPTRISSNRRGKSNAFHLPVNSEIVRVCKKFFLIRVITKLPNSEQSYKGKVKTHNYTNRQNRSTTGKL